MLITTSMSLSAQYGVDNIFRKYKNDSGVMSLKFEGDVSQFFNDDSEILSKIESIDIMIFGKDKDMSKKDLKKLITKLADEKYEVLVQAKDGDKRIKLLGIEDGDILKKVFAQINSEKMNVYFILLGDIHLKDLSKLNFDKISDISF